MGIKLSPKHGVNPTIPVCFWCGKPKNELALLGRLKDDEEAPRNCVLDYEPCEECQKTWKLGVALLGASEKPIDDSLPPIKNSSGKVLYPTGQWIVITKEAAKRYFSEVATETITEEEIDNLDSVLVEQKLIDCLSAEFAKTIEDEGEE